MTFAVLPYLMSMSHALYTPKNSAIMNDGAAMIWEPHVSSILSSMKTSIGGFRPRFVVI